MPAKRKSPQSDLFREPDKPEPEAMEHEQPPEENEMRAYARQILAEKKAKEMDSDG